MRFSVVPGAVRGFNLHPLLLFLLGCVCIRFKGVYLCASVLSLVCRFIPHPTQVVGKMRVEGHPVIPFRMSWMKRFEGEGDDMLSKHMRIHGGKEGT